MTYPPRRAYTHAAGYGVHEMVENMIVEFNMKSKVTKDKCIILVRLVHLILDGDIAGWQSR